MKFRDRYKKNSKNFKTAYVYSSVSTLEPIKNVVLLKPPPTSEAEFVCLFVLKRVDHLYSHTRDFSMTGVKITIIQGKSKILTLIVSVRVIFKNYRTYICLILVLEFLGFF